jgi:hypothetical protein
MKNYFVRPTLITQVINRVNLKIEETAYRMIEGK